MPKDRKKPADISKWADLQQQFLGLTQTCRQLRAEFMPVYRTKTVHEVHIADIPKYVGDYIQAGISEDKDATGNIVIELPSGNERVDRMHSVYLTPLIRLRLAVTYSKPKFLVRFRYEHGSLFYHGPGLARELDQLVSFERTTDAPSAWELYVRNALHAVCIKTDGPRVGLRMYVKRGHDEEFIKEYGQSTSSHWTKALDDGERRARGDWERRVGLQTSELNILLFSMDRS
jgi:hypothetical protein